MTYTLIGTGNMAWLLASRMMAAGHTCLGIWGRSAAATDELCEAYSLPRLTPLSAVNDGPDACIIAVSDAAIGDVAKSLSLRHTTLLHTGGSVPMRVLETSSAHSGVVWPVYSIRKTALPTHRAFPALIEGNSHTSWEVARSVAKAICDTSYEASSAQREWLHLGAVIANNFVNHLLGIAGDIAASQAMPISLLQPLIEQTISNLRTLPPAQSQTGPARRGDAITMQHHAHMLAAHPEWQELYRTVSASIMKRYGVIGS